MRQNNRTSDELHHYGVLGMKLGTRKGLTRQNASNYKGKGLTVAQANRRAITDNAAAKKQAKADKKEARKNMTAKEKFSRMAGRSSTEAYLYHHGSIEVTWKN